MAAGVEEAVHLGGDAGDALEVRVGERWNVEITAGTALVAEIQQGAKSSDVGEEAGSHGLENGVAVVDVGAVEGQQGMAK